jgi:hypothetical protein
MMNLTILTEKINAIFNANKLFYLAREKKFILRARQINPLKLLLSITNTLGCQSKANLADIHRIIKELVVCQLTTNPFIISSKSLNAVSFLEAVLKT